MKAFVFALLTAILVLGLTAGDFHRGGLTDDHFKDLSEDNTTATRTVSDAIPRVAIRFDDGRANAWGNDADNADAGATWQIQAFLRRGLPVSIPILSGETPDGANGGSLLSWEDMREIIAYADDYGTDVEFVCHGNTDFDNVYSGDYGDLVGQFTHDDLRENLGREFNVFVQMGTPMYKSFTRRNIEIISSILDSLGYSWANLDYDHTDSNSNNFVRAGGRIQSTPTFTSSRTNPMGAITINAAKPGMITSRFRNGGGTASIDLGRKCVERDGTEGSNASGWTMADDSGMADADIALAYDATWAHLYSSLLADNMGFVIVMHDSIDTNDNYAFQTASAANSIGHFSPEHVAWTLKELEDAGHIVVVTLSEWYEWASSEYKPGINLIANPTMEIPQWQIGDTLGCEYPWPRGFSTQGTAYSAWSSTFVASNSPLDLLDIDENQEGGLGGKYCRRKNDPGDYFGVAAGVPGYKGRAGGFESLDGSSKLTIGWGNLQPGRYVFSMALQFPDGAAATGFEIRGIYQAFGLLAQELEASWEAEGSRVVPDTLITWMWTNRQISISDPPSDEEGDWHVYDISIHLPKYPLGETLISPYWGDSVNEMGEDGQSPWLYNAAAHERIWLTEDILWLWGTEIVLPGGMRMSCPQLRYLGP